MSICNPVIPTSYIVKVLFVVNTENTLLGKSKNKISAQFSFSNSTQIGR